MHQYTNLIQSNGLKSGHHDTYSLKKDLTEVEQFFPSFYACVNKLMNLWNIHDHHLGLIARPVVSWNGLTILGKGVAPERLHVLDMSLSKIPACPQPTVACKGQTLLHFCILAVHLHIYSFTYLIFDHYFHQQAFTVRVFTNFPQCPASWTRLLRLNMGAGWYPISLTSEPKAIQQRHLPLSRDQKTSPMALLILPMHWLPTLSTGQVGGFPAPWATRKRQKCLHTWVQMTWDIQFC